MYYGVAALCVERILFAYEFTVSVFYELQIILIVVLLKCEVDLVRYFNILPLTFILT